VEGIVIDVVGRRERSPKKPVAGVASRSRLKRFSRLPEEKSGNGSCWSRRPPLTLASESEGGHEGCRMIDLISLQNPNFSSWGRGSRPAPRLPLSGTLHRSARSSVAPRGRKANSDGSNPADPPGVKSQIRMLNRLRRSYSPPLALPVSNRGRGGTGDGHTTTLRSGLYVLPKNSFIGHRIAPLCHSEFFAYFFVCRMMDCRHGAWPTG